MIADVNGIELYYEVRGSGRPLVMLHGNGEDHTIFDEAAEILQDAFCCYLVDSRCHGRSTDTPQLHYSDMAGDIVALIDTLGLENVAVYGFSDGGIIGLMAAAASRRVTTLIVSGANMTPRGVKGAAVIGIFLMNLLRKDKKLRLMLKEPQLTEDDLAPINARTLVLAGSGDLIKERETRRIAAAIPSAELRIIEGEDHGSYIVHSTKIAGLISDFCGKE